MISVTSVTDKYILQPTLLNNHKKTLEWLSMTVLWKRELAFFQKLLDQYAAKFSTTEDKKKLAEMLESRDETKTEYFKEHGGLMNELEALNTQFVQYKEELFEFIEKVM